MDELLADLIIEHREDLSTYLFIRALYEKNGKNGYVDVDHHIDPVQLDILQDSGYVSYSWWEDNCIIQVADESGRWLYLPPEVNMPKRKDNKKYTPMHLIELAEKLGYPTDWVVKTAKYTSNYFSLTKREDMYIINLVADFVAKEYPEYDLNVFLTKSWFDSFKNQQANPGKSKKPEIRDRASEVYEEWDPSEYKDTSYE